MHFTRVIGFSKAALAMVMASTMVACGGGDGDDDKLPPTVDLSISASVNADVGSSYENSKADIRIGYSQLPFASIRDRFPLRDAMAYIDVNGDGNTDVFVGTGLFRITDEVDSQLFINGGGETFTLDNSAFNGSVAPATHARKTIVADFNGDLLNDMLIFDHGFDADPFPGSTPKLIMQTSIGSLSWSRLEAQTGFHHGGAAADIDNDGDIDVFVGGFDSFFFINDGAGNFTKANNYFSSSIGKIFTAELIDVDKDGFVDLLVGAHEQDGDGTTIYWGSTRGSYTQSNSTVLPAFSGYGTILDFEAEDLDGDGDRDVVVNRTGGGNGNNFYFGRRTQILRHDGTRGFSDVTASVVSDENQAGDDWFPWLRAQDIDNDGDIDIFSDDAERNYLLRNDGSGQFVREGEYSLIIE